jgi:hypothetical protein
MTDLYDGIFLETREVPIIVEPHYVMKQTTGE